MWHRPIFHILLRVLVSSAMLLPAFAGCGNTSAPQIGVLNSALGTCPQITSFTSNVASPQNPGTTVTFTAASSCNSGATPEYRFWIYDPSVGWSIKQAYSTTATFAWNTTGFNNGTYNVDVEARAQGSVSSSESDKQIAYTLGTASCSSVSLGVSPSSPQAPGTSVAITGTASCTGGATAEYRFWALDPSGAWSVLQTWTTTATYNWSTTNYGTGSYTLYVEVRTQGSSTGNAEGHAQAPYSLGSGTTCNSISLAADSASPSNVGTTVTFTASATCSGGGTPSYRFWINDPYGNWTVVQTWGATNLYVWNTTSKAVGNYTVYAETRNQSSTGNAESYSQKPWTLTSTTACNSVSFTTSPTSPQVAGTAVTVSATATCSGGVTPTYRYWVGTSSSWMLGQDWSTSASFNWNTTGLASGTYTIEVETRASGSNATYEAFSKQSYTITTGTCSNLHIGYSNSSAPQGNVEQFTLSAICTSTPNYRYFITPPGATAALVKDWDSSPRSYYALDSINYLPGTYTITVDVRSGSSGPPLATSSVSYTVTANPGLSVWDMKECQGTTVADWTGNGHILQACSGTAAQFTWSARGQTAPPVPINTYCALDFVANECATAGDFAAADPTSAGLSVEAWVKLDGTAKTGAIVSKIVPGSNTGYMLWLNAGVLTLRVDGFDIIGTTPIQDNQWHYVSFDMYQDFSGYNAVLYLDALQIGFRSTGSTPSQSMGGSLTIGAVPNGYSPAFPGLVDIVRIINSGRGGDYALDMAAF